MKILLSESQIKRIVLMEGLRNALLLEADNAYQYIDSMIKAGFSLEDILNSIYGALGFSEADKKGLVDYAKSKFAQQADDDDNTVQRSKAQNPSRPNNTITIQPSQPTVPGGNNAVQPEKDIKNSKKGNKNIDKKDPRKTNDGNQNNDNAFIDRSIDEAAYNAWNEYFKSNNPKGGHLCARATYWIAHLFTKGTVNSGATKIPCGAGDAGQKEYAKNIVRNLGYEIRVNQDGLEYEDVTRNVEGYQRRPGDIFIYYVTNCKNKGNIYTYKKKNANNIEQILTGTVNKPQHAQFCVSTNRSVTINNTNIEAPIFACDDADNYDAVFVYKKDLKTNVPYSYISKQKGWAWHLTILRPTTHKTSFKTTPKDKKKH